MAAAASGGGSSSRIDPSYPTSFIDLGFASREAVFLCAQTVLSKISEKNTRPDCLAEIHSILGDKGPLNEKTIGLFFKIAAEEGKCTHTDPSFESNLHHLFHLVPEIADMAGEASFLVLTLTDEAGTKLMRSVPFQLSKDSDLIETLVSCLKVGEGFEIPLPPGVVLEDFDRYLTFCETKKLPEGDLQSHCALLKISDYLMNESTSTALLKELKDKLEKGSIPNDLLIIIKTLGTAPVFQELINICLSKCIIHSIKTNNIPELMPEFARLGINEILDTLPISLNISSIQDDIKVTNEILELLTTMFPTISRFTIEMPLFKILTPLARLSLTHLKISWGILLKDAALAPLAKLTQLSDLDLSYCSSIRGPGLIYLAGMTRLSNLNLSGCPINDAGLEHIAGLSLTDLNLSSCYEIEDAGLKHIAKISQLRCLSLSDCRNITNEGIANLAGLSQLTILDLSECDLITDEVIESIAGLSQLKTLNLSRCMGITEEGLTKLRRLRPDLRLLVEKKAI